MNIRRFLEQRLKQSVLLLMAMSLVVAGTARPGQAQMNMPQAARLPFLGQPVTASTAPKSQPATSSQPAESPEIVMLRSAKQTLTTGKIESTPDGLRSYLRGLHPSEQQRLQADEWIRQLANPDWRQREAASTALMNTPVLPVEQLRRATTCGDLEVETRAKDILAKREQQLPTMLQATFSVIQLEKFPGMIDDVQAAIPLCGSKHLQDSAALAIRATARREDVDLLRKMAKDPHSGIRKAALMGLAGVLGAGSSDELAAMMKDSDPQVALAAASELAELKDRRCLDGFATLMRSEDASVRSYAFSSLSSLTNNDSLPFDPFANDDQRARQLEAWQTWLAANAATVTLGKLRRESTYDESFLYGHTLIAYGNRNLVEELDASGNVVWSCADTPAWSAEKLRSGNVLISVFTNNQVIEVNPKGDIVWEYQARSMSAKELPNGNILLCDQGTQQVLEVSRNKQVVWSAKLPGVAIMGASRLPNGNTLLATNRGAREITPDNNTVWEYSGGATWSVQRLCNGNTLISDNNKNRIIEVTPQNSIVWEFSETQPCNVFRLPNGNTLITSMQRAIEVTPEKQIVWEKTGVVYGSVRK